MARQTQYKKIIQMLFDGASRRTIENTLQVSSKSITLCNQLVKGEDMTAEDFMKLTESDLKEIISSQNGAVKVVPDWQEVFYKHASGDTTLMETWKEYKEECCRKDQNSLSYSRFCGIFAQYKLAARYSHLEIKPGEYVFAQWTSGVELYDQASSEVTKIYIFIGILPFSQNIFFRCADKRDLKNWITSIIGMLSCFEGTPNAIMCPKYRATFSGDEPVHQFVECAEHYGMTIVTERADIHKEISYLIKEIIGHLDDRYPSVSSLYSSLFDVVENVLTYHKSDRPSRRDSFQTMEKPLLQPLPDTTFEYYDEQKHKIRLDYHVECDGMFYSVPSHWSLQIDKTVIVRKTEKTISIYKWGDKIAEHQILTGFKGQYSTCSEHMPTPETEQWYPWNRNHFLLWAEKYGPNTKKVINRILDDVEFAPQAYRTCFNILRLAKIYSPEKLEKACNALPSLKGLNYSLIKQTINIVC